MRGDLMTDFSANLAKHVRPAASTTPPVIAAVLNWNNLTDTLDCLESLRRSAYPNLRIWLVDNGSSEDPTPVVHRRHPDVRDMRPPANVGYGGGNNAALVQALRDDA